MQIQLIIIIIVALIGCTVLIKSGTDFQSKAENSGIVQKDVKSLYILWVIISLIMGLSIGSLFINWNEFDGSWIAFSFFGLVFVIGSIRSVQAIIRSVRFNISPQDKSED